MDGRPSPLRWLGYTFGLRLPAASSEWVLHDATCSTWFLRHCARFLVQLSPLVIAVPVFLPTGIGLRLGCVFGGLAASMLLSFGYVVESAERRVERAGYPYGLAEKLRQQRADNAQRTSAARRREKLAARRARRA